MVSTTMWSLLLAGLAALSSTRAAPMDSRGLGRLQRTANLTARAQFPSSGITGVNLGTWFVFEPYMAVDEWINMGGDGLCGDCTSCVNDEFSLTAKLGQGPANDVFKNHWATFITQDDVNLMKQYGINSVRIPLGFWIIESTVNSDETYPQGGLDALRTGAKMFNDAGISILLDMHAAPGAQTASNPFTGRCTSSPQFWNQGNFDRMNDAVKQLVTIVHQEPDNFGSVYGIEALNEPPTDGSQTPGYADFMKQFVAAVRGAESALGVADADQLSTTFMDVSWQFTNNAGNPAFAADGGNAYDSHLYYSFGAPCGNNGCVQPTLDSHVTFACQGGGGRIGNDASQFNTPSFLGEWWLEALPGAISDNFDKASYQRFGDAQKRGYSPEGGNGGSGWYFWSWKMTNSDSDGTNHLRSYKDAVDQGYLPATASSYFDGGVCG